MSVRARVENGLARSAMAPTYSRMIAKHLVRALVAVAFMVGCNGISGRPAERIVVFNAGSLAIPIRAALDSFAARELLLHGIVDSRRRALLRGGDARDGKAN